MSAERIAAYLRDGGVSGELIDHQTAYTMSEVAAALHVSGKQVAKVVMLAADERLVMIVLRSCDRLDMKKVRQVLDAGKVSLANEAQFKSAFPDCVVGAMPALGRLYGLPVILDNSLAAEGSIYFRTGTHEQVIKMTLADYVRLEKPQVDDLALK